MNKRCIVCKKELQDEEKEIEICKNCLAFLKKKYLKKENLNQSLKLHKYYSKKQKQRKTKKLTMLLLVLFLMTTIILPLTLAQDYDEILRPLMNVYDFIKYAATVIASIVLVFAGITYITSGSDPKKREQAKNMVMYVVIGLAVIWAAPYIIELVMG